MIYPYRMRASKSDSEIREIESVVHQQHDPLSTIEHEMKKRGQKQENGADN